MYFREILITYANIYVCVLKMYNVREMEKVCYAMYDP